MSDANQKELDQLTVAPDRPPSLDKTGRRLFVIPANVSGFFRKRRSVVYAFLIVLFLVVPWTTFNGRQTIFLDITKRRFLFFDNLFFAHDAPLIFFLLAIVAFSIIFLTALLGRVWCGWACPQTVFIDFIYRRIEEWTEGNYLVRRKLENEKPTLKSIFWKTTKWILFFVASSHITHSFFAYFIGATELLQITLNAPSENWPLFIGVQTVTLLLLVNFGWFREQFCLIACPYGRFQSALMDENSMAVLYDKNRGEPRRQKGGSKEDQGDCINCLRCVNVCPTGIDIRNGLQMECITCTACVDACDEIMEKIKKPLGLIRYSSEAEMNGKQRKPITLRNLVYGFLLIGLLTGATLSVLRRDTLEIDIVRAIEAPYQFANAERTSVINHFRFHLTNQSNYSLQIIELNVDNEKVRVVAPQLNQLIEPGQSAWIHVFFTFPAAEVKNGTLPLGYRVSFRAQTKSYVAGMVNLLAP